MFDEAYHPLLGVGAKAAGSLSEDQLRALVTVTSAPDPRRLATLVEVMKVEGDLHTELGQLDAAYVRYRRALALACDLADSRDGLPDPGVAAELAERLGDYDLPGRVRLQLCRLYEALGRYADAEDELFEAIDDRPDDDAIVDAGIAFYQRLLALDPERLVAGNLPRPEAEASLAELLRRAVSE